MVFVNDDMILVSLSDSSEQKEKQRIYWHIFNVRQGTLVRQQDKSGEIQINDGNYEVACPDFSNLDNP